MNYALHSFSLLSGFCPIGFFRLKVFNEAINASIKGRDHKYLCTILFFPFVWFLSHWFFRLKVFNEAVSFNAHS